MPIDRAETQSPTYVKGNNLLRDQVVVVTAGAGAGIGGAAVRRSLEEGARAVVVGDVHEKRLSRSREELSEEFGQDRISSVACDVTDESQIKLLFDEADRFGGVDVLINNAGLGGNAAVQDMRDEEWARVIDVTLTGVFRATRAASQRMIERNVGGAIINNASIVGSNATAGMAHYSAAKAGVMAFTRSSAIDLAPHGIRVNAVSPSMVMHPHLRKVADDAFLDEQIAAEAFGRSAEPWEVANVMMFLASGYSSYMTGEVVSVSYQQS